MQQRLAIGPQHVEGDEFDRNVLVEKQVGLAAAQTLLQREKVELFPVGEAHDLAATEPAKLEEMTLLLTQKYKEVRAESPIWPAWKFTGIEGKHIVWPDYVKKAKAKAAPPAK